MKKITILSLCISLIMVFSASAQQSGNAQAASTSFDYTLMTLRESVDKLTRDNREQEETNGKMRVRLRDIADELKALERDEVRLLDQIGVVDARYEKKMANSKSPEAQASRLRQESSAIDEEFAKLTAAIASKEKAGKELRSAISALEKDIFDLKAGEYSIESEEGVRLFQERERLRQQRDALMDSVQQTRQQWLDIQGVHALGSERMEALRRSRDDLVGLLKDQRAINVGLIQEVAEEERLLAGSRSPAKTYSTAAAALEQELVGMKARSVNLDREIEKLKRSNEERNQKNSESLETEQRQWEAKLVDGEDWNRALREELDKLRKEMIGLDKKKAMLEQSL